MARSSGRLTRFLKASVDAMLTPAEDPRTLFADQAHQQRQLLMQLGSARQRLEASRERLERQRVEAVEQADGLQVQARHALTAGREDLARLALRRQQMIHREIKDLDRQVAALEREATRISEIEQRLRAQIEAVRSREQIAVARRTAAEAQVAVSEALFGAGVTPSDPDVVARIERDADVLEARADAIEELIAAGMLGLGGELEAGAFTGDDADIESRLDALKQDVSDKRP